MVSLLEMLIMWVCKIGLQKICKIFTFEFGIKSGVMRGFQKDITLGGRTSGSACKVWCMLTQFFNNFQNSTIDHNLNVTNNTQQCSTIHYSSVALIVVDAPS